MARQLGLLERAKLEQEFDQARERAEKLRILHGLGMAIASAMELEQVLTRIVEAAVFITKAEEGSLLLLDEETHELHLRAQKGLGDKYARGFRVQIHDSIAGLVLQSGEPQRLTAADKTVKVVTGYLVNAILLQGLIKEYDIIFIDEASHYSVFDGTYTTRKPIIPFVHLNPEDLKKKIRNSIKPSQKPLLICDGVFPVSGEISPIPEYLSVLEEFAPYIICVDDAHATGVLGENGRGVYDYFGLEAGDGLYSSGTLSKAVGGHGGIIAGKEAFIDGLRKSSEIFQGASPASTPAAAAASKGLEILMNRPELRKNLWANVRHAKHALRSIGFEIPETPVPIICLHREGIDLKQIQAELFRKNIAVLYAAGGSYSSVPKNGAIRIAIFSTHSKEQIDRLVKEIQRLMSTLA